MTRICIVGGGAMGGAMARRLALMRDDLSITVCDTSAAARKNLASVRGLCVLESLSDAGDCDALVLAVKPAGVRSVLEEAASASVGLVVSVAAGISLDKLEAWSGKASVRVMPNTPCSIGQGMSVAAFGETVSPEQRSLVLSLFESMGQVLELPESSFSAATALSGAGPAYVYLLIEALVDAGCAQGLARSDAKQLVTAAFAGASAMVSESTDHTAVLRDMVTSPGGVTIDAIGVMEKRGIRGILWEAVEGAAVKSSQMSK